MIQRVFQLSEFLSLVRKLVNVDLLLILNLLIQVSQCADRITLEGLKLGILVGANQPRLPQFVLVQLQQSVVQVFLKLGNPFFCL